LHQHVYEADYAIVLDDSLAEERNIFNHLKPRALVVIATKSKKKPEEFKAREGITVKTVDAYAIAREAIGKPFVNAAMLGAFAKATGLVSLEGIEKAIRKRFPPEVAEKNFAAAKKCFEAVS
jgi:2-oxoacid:acceptor oxidoreductase gamma subunit (pyruvate/2-ketoisovalerate family)